MVIRINQITKYLCIINHQINKIPINNNKNESKKLILLLGCPTRNSGTRQRQGTQVFQKLARVKQYVTSSSRLQQRNQIITPTAEECSLYASGLNYNTTNEQLMTAFSPYGKVTEIVLKASKGFAFIAFDSPQTVQSALDALPSKTVRPSLLFSFYYYCCYLNGANSLSHS